MFTHPNRSSLVVAALLAAAFAWPASAATMLSVAQDGTLEDGSNDVNSSIDGNGDNFSENNNLVVGPRDNDSDSTIEEEHRGGLRFDISGIDAEIDNAAQILLDVTTSASDNNFEKGDPDFDIELYGLNDAGGSLAADDFEAAADLLATIAHGDIAADTLYSLDVTGFVQDAKTTGESSIEFRLQAASFVGTPDSGTGLFVTRFDSDAADNGDTSDAPQLRVIPVPEPATLALLGLGGAVMLAGRKRRR